MSHIPTEAEHKAVLAELNRWGIIERSLDPEARDYVGACMVGAVIAAWSRVAERDGVVSRPLKKVIDREVEIRGLGHLVRQAA